MTAATREALRKVQQVLHEAGWDTPPEQKPEPTPGKIEILRRAYGSLRCAEYFQLLDKTLGDREPVEQASRAMGLSEEEGRKLFHEALCHLGRFVSACEE